MDSMTPPLTVLVKLGSLAVHIEEYLSPQGHKNDRIAIESLLDDPELKGWLWDMDRVGLLPRKR